MHNAKLRRIAHENCRKKWDSFVPERFRKFRKSFGFWVVLFLWCLEISEKFLEMRVTEIIRD